MIKKSGYSVTVACDATSVKEWFDPTHPLEVRIIPSDIAMRFRRNFLKGFIRPGSCNFYLGAFLNKKMFGVLGFSNPSYGNYDVLLKADTTPSQLIKSIDLLLFLLRTKEVQKLLEQKFCRKIDNIMSCCFSVNDNISRYRKHAKLINKKVIKKNKKNTDEKNKRKCNSRIAYLLKTKTIKKQPCKVCGETSYVEFHHPDYSKPEEGVWLCVKHHNEADGIDETCYTKLGYELSYIFESGSICSLKEAKAQFIQKSCK